MSFHYEDQGRLGGGSLAARPLRREDPPIVRSSLMEEPAFVTLGRESFHSDGDVARTSFHSEGRAPSPEVVESLRPPNGDDAGSGEDHGVAWVPLRTPTSVGKRFNTLGNTFLNVGSVDEVERTEEEMRRHTFGEFANPRSFADDFNNNVGDEFLSAMFKESSPPVSFQEENATGVSRDEPRLTMLTQSDSLTAGSCEREFFADSLESPGGMPLGLHRNDAAGASSTSKSSEILAKWKQDKSSRSSKPFSLKLIEEVGRQSPKESSFSTNTEGERPVDLGGGLYQLPADPVFSTFDGFDDRTVNLGRDPCLLGGLSSNDDGRSAMPTRGTDYFGTFSSFDEVPTRSLSVNDDDDDVFQNRISCRSLGEDSLDFDPRAARRIMQDAPTLTAPGRGSAAAVQTSSLRPVVGRPDLHKNLDAVPGEPALSELLANNGMSGVPGVYFPSAPNVAEQSRHVQSRGGMPPSLDGARSMPGLGAAPEPQRNERQMRSQQHMAQQALSSNAAGHDEPQRTAPTIPQGHRDAPAPFEDPRLVQSQPAPRSSRRGAHEATAQAPMLGRGDEPQRSRGQRVAEPFRASADSSNHTRQGIDSSQHPDWATRAVLSDEPDGGDDVTDAQFTAWIASLGPAVAQAAAKAAASVLTDRRWWQQNKIAGLPGAWPPPEPDIGRKMPFPPGAWADVAVDGGQKMASPPGSWAPQEHHYAETMDTFAQQPHWQQRGEAPRVQAAARSMPQRTQNLAAGLVARGAVQDQRFHDVCDAPCVATRLSLADHLAAAPSARSSARRYERREHATAAAAAPPGQLDRSPAAEQSPAKPSAGKAQKARKKLVEGQDAPKKEKPRIDCREAKTFMVRNIPVRYTQDMLLQEWPNDRGMYDFLYLPICIDRKRNVSFAFINFSSTEFAMEFHKTWHKQRLLNFSTRKPLDISPADVQGRDENLLQIVKNKTFRIRNIHFQPAIFHGPERQSMEEFLEGLDKRTSVIPACHVSKAKTAQTSASSGCAPVVQEVLVARGRENSLNTQISDLNSLRPQFDSDCNVNPPLDRQAVEVDSVDLAGCRAIAQEMYWQPVN